MELEGCGEQKGGLEEEKKKKKTSMLPVWLHCMWKGRTRKKKKMRVRMCQFEAKKGRRSRKSERVGGDVRIMSFLFHSMHDGGGLFFFLFLLFLT